MGTLPKSCYLVLPRLTRVKSAKSLGKADFTPEDLGLPLPLLTISRYRGGVQPVSQAIYAAGNLLLASLCSGAEQLLLAS
eukprot:1147412-Pelagomonas_calceolata.AAC.3